jgi:CRISPR/Cas system CSM-associated protein Csm3 (group 7 of RAMP superfamily)
MTAGTLSGGQPGAIGAPARTVTLIRCVLRFDDPGGVTVPRLPDRDEVDAVLDTDPWGRPQLPGTSLAGALRELVGETLGPDAADRLFGRLLERGTGVDEVDAVASQVWVLGGSLVTGDGGEAAETRGKLRASTAIDRRRAAAANATLRREEVLPAGARFELFLRWDDAAEDELDAFLRLLVGWRPLLGRGVSRGRGLCSIEEVRSGALRLDDAGDLLRWLTLSGPELVREVATVRAVGSGQGSAPPLLAALQVRIAGPVRVGSGERSPAGGGKPEVALMLTGDDVGHVGHVGGYVVPATSLSGLLRSRAEYILRSVGVAPLPCVDQRCGRCWTCRVFGFGGGRDVGSATVGARARVRFADAAVADPVRVLRQHVAIDRFTGGAQEGLLYTMEALEGGHFTLELWDLGLVGEEASQLRAVLRLVADDLNDGIVGLGGGVARGYGSVTVDVDAAQARGDLPDRQAARAVLAAMLAPMAATTTEDPR